MDIPIWREGSMRFPIGGIKVEFRLNRVGGCRTKWYDESMTYVQFM